jgi:hypothetical protein
LNVTHNRIDDQKLHEEETLISKLPGKLETLVRERIGSDAFDEESE